MVEVSGTGYGEGYCVDFCEQTVRLVSRCDIKDDRRERLRDWAGGE